jgi:hypothetical protein
MSFDVHAASAPVFVRALRAIPHWIDKAVSDGHDEAAILEARLAPDMRAFPAQIQMASDTAKLGVARLTGVAAPPMADTEASLVELTARCLNTIAFIESVDPAAFVGAEDRPVELKFPNGMGYRFNGAEYLTGFALPNFFFHVSMAYALLRANGVAVGKPDFLMHLGPPIQIG